MGYDHAMGRREGTDDLTYCKGKIHIEKSRILDAQRSPQGAGLNLQVFEAMKTCALQRQYSSYGTPTNTIG